MADSTTPTSAQRDAPSIAALHLLQRARAFQHSPPFREYRRRRQVVEHAIARLVQRGVRQARYRGRPKTRFQLLMASAVVNLTLLVGLHGVFSPLLLALGALFLALYGMRGPVNVSLPPDRFIGLRPPAPRSSLPSHS